MSIIRTLHVRVDGRVQGVGYRAWVKGAASTIGLTGWVRNRRDGSVEMVLQGPSESVEEMLRSCKRGPPDSDVAKVEVLGEGVGAYKSFEVMSTA